MFNKEIENFIFESICEGVKMKDIAKRLNVSQKTLFVWVRKHNSLRIAVEDARKIQANTYIEQLIDIADNEDSDPRKAQLQIKVRKTLAKYLHPKKYDDQKKQTGEDRTNVFVGLKITPPKEVADGKSYKVVEHKGE